MVVLKMVDGYKVMIKYEGEWLECEDELDAVDAIHDMVEPVINEKNKTIYIEDAQDDWMD